LITEGKDKESFNQKRIELLSAVRNTIEFFLMILAVYCLTMSLFLEIYDIKTVPLKLSLAIASFTMAFFNVFRNIISSKIEEEYGRSPMTDVKLTTDLKTHFRDHIIHTLLILVFPNDFFKLLPTYQLKESLFFVEVNLLSHIVQLNKVSFVFAYFVGASYYYSDSAFRVCSMFNAFRDWMFVIKCRMRDNPLGTLIPSLVTVVYLFSYALYITEFELPKHFGESPIMPDFKTHVWLMCVTITTGRPRSPVGYGDNVPRTKLGMCIVFFSGLCGMVITSLLISNITEQLNLASNEELAYGLISKLDLSAETEEKANLTFQSLVKLRRLRANHKLGKASEKDLQAEEKLFEQRVSELRESRRSYKDFEIGSTDQDNERNFELVTRELKEIRKLIFAIFERSTSLGIIPKNNGQVHMRNRDRRSHKMSIQTKKQEAGRSAGRHPIPGLLKNDVVAWEQEVANAVIKTAEE